MIIVYSFGSSDSVGCDADAAAVDDDDGSVFRRKNDDIHNMAETIFLRFTICSISYCCFLLPGISIKICVLFFNLGFLLFNIFSVVCFASCDLVCVCV